MPKDAEDQIEAALGASHAIKSVHGTEFKVGSLCSTLYPAYGNIVDWMYARKAIKYSYVAHLRDTGTVCRVFQLSFFNLLDIYPIVWIFAPGKMDSADRGRNRRYDRVYREVCREASEKCVEMTLFNLNKNEYEMAFS